MRQLFFGFGIVLLTGLALRWVLFQGHYLTPSSTPPPTVVDLHCHTAGIGGGNSGCFISKAMRDSYKFDIYLRAFSATRQELETQGDSLLIRRIASKLAASQQVHQAVILALDGSVRPDGTLDTESTEVYIPNSFIAREVAQHTNLLFGASVNPYRRDALAQLDWCATNGAVLMKWIPSVMGIDPGDTNLVPFYRRLIHHRMPLLTHTGQERSFTNARDELCDPVRLRLPLQLGVTVIAAHIASTGSNEGQRDTDRLKPLMQEYTNLWTELSSLTQVNKLGYLKEALTAPEFRDRLLYGSDFPLVNTALVSPWYYPLNLTREQMEQIASIENPWDRDVALKRSLGVPTEVFTRNRSILRSPASRTE